MVNLFAGTWTSAAIFPISRGEISFASDNRFDPFLLHRVIESDRAVHVAMISHGARVHTQFQSSLCQRVYLNRAVEEAVVSMQVEVNEIFVWHGQRSNLI